MKRTWIALTMAGALCACTTTQNADFHFKAEQADTDANLAYVGLASILNDFEAAHPDKKQAAEDIKSAAWKALLTIRAAYAAGQAINLTQFQAINAQGYALAQEK